MIAEVFTVDVDRLRPTLRRFFCSWLEEGMVSGSVVICEALRFPSVGSSDSAGFSGSTAGMFVLEELAVTSPAFCSFVNQKDIWHTRDALPLAGLADPR